MQPVLVRCRHVSACLVTVFSHLRNAGPAFFSQGLPGVRAAAEVATSRAPRRSIGRTKTCMVRAYRGPRDAATGKTPNGSKTRIPEHVRRRTDRRSIWSASRVVPVSKSGAHDGVER